MHGSDTLELFMERFPKLGLVSFLWVPKEPVEEKKPLPKLSDSIELLYIYGFHPQAYKHYRNWLHGHPDRRCVFLEDEPGVIAGFFYTPEMQELLLDSQVFIEVISPEVLQKKRDIKAMAQQFHASHIEIVSLPSRRGAKFRSLRLYLLRQLTLTHSEYIDRTYDFQLFGNFVQNLSVMPRSFYANRLKGSFSQIPAIVCGAGPSLKAAIPFLKAFQDQILIIAGGSSVVALTSQGVKPHFAMAVDPNPEEHHRFQNQSLPIPLLYSTRLFPQVLSSWPGPLGYMRTALGGMHELWLGKHLNLSEPLLEEALDDETLSVTSFCLAWVEVLGCSCLLLAGLDLAYTGNKHYSEGVVSTTSFEAMLKKQKPWDRIYQRKDSSGKRVYTAVRWLMEASVISRFAKRHPHLSVVNTTPAGLKIKGVPCESLETVLQKVCKGPLQLEEKIKSQIQKHPMPETTSFITQTEMKKLQKSLERVIQLLEILSHSSSLGKKALAEIELEEELAFFHFFYDAEKLYGEKEDRWKYILIQAKRYLNTFAPEQT